MLTKEFNLYLLLVAKFILTQVSEVSGVCDVVLCLQEKSWTLNLHHYPLNHSLSCLPLGFHWYSVRVNLSTDWFLQTDAEGDTHSLINWPSRYTQAGCVSAQDHLPCSHPAGLKSINSYKQHFLNCRSGQDQILFATKQNGFPLTIILSFRVKLHLLSSDPGLIWRHICLWISAF